MGSNPILNCSALVVRKSFTDYVQALNITTHGNLSLAVQCKREVCNALWGSGNPDISGIGTTAGYFLENGIAFLLTGAIICARRNHGTSRRLMRVLTRSYESFYSCAIFLTFSLQIAAMVILVQTNFGSSTVGAYTLQTTWSVSLLCLLPLMYGTFMPELFEEQHNGMELHPEQSTSSEEKQREMRATLRFWLYHLCWMLSIYPFGSSLLNTFGPSQIGNHPESAISDKDWNKIASVCLSGVDQISRAENVAMRGLLLSTWLFVYLATIGRLVILALKPHYRHHAITKRLKRLWPQSVRPLHTQVVFLISVTLLGGGQFWTYLRLHRAQMQMSAAAGNPDMDEQWSFGQIVAVSVFAPVLVEAMFATRVSALPDCGTSTTTLSTSAEEFRPSKAK